MQPRVEEKSNRDLVLLNGEAVTTSTEHGPAFDVELFIHDYFDAWSGTDEERILSFYADNVVLQIPGVLIKGKEALRDQFVRPFITAFPGNCHRVKNMIFGRGVVNVEFSFEALHTGPFARHAATGAQVVVPGCAVYEYDSAKRQITAARIYFDMGTLLQSITDFSQNVRNQASVALHLNERNLSLIINTIPTHIYVLDTEGFVQFVNQAIIDYTGLSLEDVKQADYRERVIHPEDFKRVRAERAAGLKRGVPFSTEQRVLANDGQYRWFLVRYKPLLDEQGRIVRWYVAAFDMEDRKRAEAQLEQAYIFLAEGQRLSKTGSWAWNASTGKLTWSQEHFRILGLDAQITNPTLDVFWERVHPDDRIGLRHNFESAIRDKRDFDQEFRVVTPDLSIRHLHCVGHVILNEAHELVEFIGSTMDVTEREELTQKLRRREAYLAEAQRLSRTGSFSWNIVTGEHNWSEENYRILGYDRSVEPELELVRDRVHPDDLQMWEEAFARVSEGKQVNFEHRLILPDGSVKHLNLVAYGVQKDGKHVELVGTSMDITERKRAEAALQEARAELERVTRVTTMGELAASIAHEINQPLAGVVTSANAGLNWLAANPPNLSKVRETLERILRDGTRGGEVLARIRALLKRTPPAKTLVNVNQIVREVVALSAGQFRQNRIDLSLDLDSSVPAVLGDSVLLQQVMLNLIKNAAEAMAGIADGQRTLRIHSRLGELDGKPAVRVAVSDTGVGFSGADSARLFEAFHTTKPQGMGMGLWISRSIIESHRGRLTASPNDGPGATFVIILPKADQEPA